MLALSLIERFARQLGPDDQVAIFRRCLQLGARPIDPYATAGVVEGARLAASALLDGGSLDEEALQSVQVPALEQRALLGILASYVRRLDARGTVSFCADVIERAGLSRDASESFARDADRQVPDDSNVHPIAVRWWKRDVRGWITANTTSARHPLTAAILSGAAAPLAWFVTERGADLPQMTDIAAGDAVGAFGLLVAAVIFAFELAADRLQGFIARRVSLSPWLAAAITLAVSLIIVSGWKVRGADLAQKEQVQLVVLTGLVCTLLAALLGLLRRVDTVQAVRIYAQRSRGLFRSTGKRLGTVQRKAAAVDELTESLSWVDKVTDLETLRPDSCLTAPRRGLLTVDPARLSAMNADARWRHERYSLVVRDQVGMVVDKGDLIAAVIAEEGSSVSTDLEKTTAGAVGVEVVKRVDDVREAMSALVSLVARLGASGNSVGAERVGREATGLLQTHLEASRQSRGSTADERRSTSSPALIATVQQAIIELKGRQSSAAENALTELLDLVLSAGVQADSVPAIMAARLGVEFEPEAAPGLRLNLLWAALRRAIELDDRRGWLGARVYLTTCIDSAKDTRKWVQLLASTASYAASRQPGLVRELYRSVRKHEPAHSSLVMVLSLRICAAALSAGQLSIALLVAEDYAGTSWDRHLQRSSASSHEETHNEFWGLPLGRKPLVPLGEAARLATRLDQIRTGAKP